MKAKKLLKGFFSLLIIGTLSLLLFEACYRFQLIDFHQTEFEFLNKDETGKSSKTMFILGDSFTATESSYVDQLRANFSNYSITNSAVIGTGIRQHQLLFEKHNGEKSDILLYQFYVGNDFLDLDYPVNFNAISATKIVYRKLSEKLLCLHYLNYQLAYFRNSDKNFEQISQQAYSPEKYNQRQKELFKVNPYYLQNTIQLKGQQKKTYLVWKEKFEEITTEFGIDKPIYLVIIPHVAQLNSLWLNRMKDLGANLNELDLQTSYSLLTQLQNDFPQIKLINPLAEFKKHNTKGTKLYYQNDQHLNAQGQKVLGKYLVEQLKRELDYED